MDQAEFKVLVKRAGFRLNDKELQDLSARFEKAVRIIQPIRELDLGEGDLAVVFSPKSDPKFDES